MSIWSLPGAKQIRQSASLNTLFRIGHGPYWGKFSSRSAAEKFLTKSRTATYDSDRVVNINLEKFQVVHPFDWPVMFFLQKLQYEGRMNVVTDFGGHVGAKYHAYRNVIPLPPDIQWQVVDVPAICKEGRRRIERGNVSLSYHENLKETSACDVLLCSGSLQYADKSLDEIIRELPDLPTTIILNKISVSDEPFYTLEAFNKERMPHRIVTDIYLTTIREELGYTKATQWDIPGRNFTVPHQQGSIEVKMVGQTWIRE